MIGAAVALGGAVKGALDRADEMSKAAQKFGVPIDELSRLKYAADLSDVSLQSLGGGLGKLSKAMADAASGGSSAAAKALQTLGISATDANGALRPTGSVMQDLAGKFAGMQDGAGKTALAMAIFGKSGADLIPLLNSGKDGLAEMGAEADALGITLDEKTGKAAEAFNDNLTRLKAAGQGVTTQLAAAMAPALASISGAFVGAAKNAQFMDAVGKVLAGTIKVLATAAVAAGGVFGYFGSILGGVASALGNVAKGQFSEAMRALDGAGARAEAIAKQTGASIKAIWTTTALPSSKTATFISDQIAAPITQAGNKVKAGATRAKAEVDKAGEDLKRSYERLHDSLLSDDEKAAKEYAESLKTLDGALKAKIVTYEKYVDELERLNNKKTASELKLVDPLKVTDLTTTADAMAGIADDIERPYVSAFETMSEVTYGLQDAVSGVLGALKNGDWQSAIAGIARSFSKLKEQWSSLNTGGKIGAIAGAAAPFVGGVGGSVLSGVAAGAQLGSIIPGVGTAIGAVVGGIGGLLGGLFGKSKAKKQAKAEEARRKAEEAAQKAIDAANHKRALEIEIIELQQGATAALAEVRKDELAATDETNRETLQQVYALRDAADAADKAANVASERRGLESEYLRATGNELAALNIERADELAALDESNRALQQAIYSAQDYADAQTKAAEAIAAAQARGAEAVAAAQDRLSEARDREAAELQDTISAYQSLLDNLQDYRRELNAEGDRVGSLDAASRAFQNTASLAAQGDKGALGSLRGVSEAFRKLSRENASSDLDARRTDAQVRIAVEDGVRAAGEQISIALQSLNSLNKTVDTLLKIDTSVLSVGAAIDGYASALNAQIADLAETSARFSQTEAIAAASAGEIAALREELRAGFGAVAMNTRQTTQTLQMWNGDGMPEERAA